MDSLIAVVQANGDFDRTSSGWCLGSCRIRVFEARYPAQRCTGGMCGKVVANPLSRANRTNYDFWLVAVADTGTAPIAPSLGLGR